MISPASVARHLALAPLTRAAALATTLAATLAAAAFGQPARAAEPIPVVASFSILGDLVKEVGGDHVIVETLVGPNGDAHVFSPSAADAKKLAGAKLIVVNGLGLEGWMSRLVKASGTKAPEVVASKGITPLKAEDEDDDHDDKGHAGHHHEGFDPHAWQNIGNVEIYVANIRDGLIEVDPANKAAYEATAAAYLAKLAALQKEVKQAIDSIPPDRRRIITTHDAFGYFAKAYGFEIIAPQGVSTESEASAKDVARVIKQIKAQKIPAVFMENISDTRLMDRISKETGAKIGGKLYSDALSPPNGPAATYIAMMQSNTRELVAALAPTR